MKYTVHVTLPAPDEPWKFEPRSFSTESEAWAYAFGIVSGCRQLRGTEPIFQIDGTDHGDITADEIWLISRLAGKPLPKNA